MSEREYVYVASSAPVRELAAVLSGALGLEIVFDKDGRELQLLGPTPGWDGASTELWVEANEKLAPGAEPEDATCAYSLEVAIRVVGTVDAQEGEARRVFDALRTGRPDWPVLQTHESVTILAAYLPGAGVQVFDPPVETDLGQVSSWGSWVPDPAQRPSPAGPDGDG